MVEKEKKITEEEYQKRLSYDKTKTINEESKETKRDKHDFVNFCKYRWNLRKVRPGSTKINEDKNGDKYASIEVKAGDCPEEETERNELRLNKENDFKFNEDFKYKFSFKIPENFPLSPTRLVIGQWKYNKIEGSDEKKDPSPMLAQRIQKIDGKYYLTITDGVKNKNILRKIPFDDIKGKWVNMDYELRFSDKKDENNSPIPCTVKLKADIEGKGKIDEKKEFYLAEENKLQFDSEQTHTGYFKFGLYRDNYDYAKTKIKDKKGLDEIKQAQTTEEQNPMQIYFKNFSMENLSYREREDERDDAKADNQKKAEKLQKFYDLYLDTILAIKGLKDKKDISQNIKFLNNSQYEEKTKNGYEELFKKLKKNGDILDGIEKKIKKNKIEDLLALKKKIDELKLIKYYQKLKKYEKGEYINLPNGLSYELCTKNEEEKYGKKIPILLGENEYFIKTHVNDGATYTDYVNSLLEIKKLLENKGIKIKYCEHQTWLANKEFLRKYEETIKQKFGDKYKKTKRIQVLDQIEPAEVYYKIGEGTNPVDQQKKNGNTKKSPLRFIEGKKDKEDFLEYLEQGDNKKEFNEADMWIDLDKLEKPSEKQGEKKGENIEENGTQTIKTGLEKVENDDAVRKSYVDAFLSLVGDNKNLSKIVESLKNGAQMELSIKDIENIYNELNNIYLNSRKDFIDQKLKGGIKKEDAKDEFRALSKFCMDPKAIKEYKTFNCSGASFIMASIIESLGGTVYMAKVYHHVVCIAEIQGRQYIIDTEANRHEDITDKVKIEDTEYDFIKKFSTKKPLFKEYTEGYVFGSLQQAEKTIHAGNYESIDKVKYNEVREKITGLVTEEKIDSYPKKGESDYPPKFLLNDNYPEFDRKIGEIHDKQGKVKTIFGKIKLKVQELLARFKRRFSRK